MPSPTTTAKRHMSLDTATTFSAADNESSSRYPYSRSQSFRSTHLLAKKRVSFETVDVFEHPITLGDNVVSEGAPLTIEWHAQRCDILSVDDYERFKSSNRTSPNQ